MSTRLSRSSSIISLPISHLFRPSVTARPYDSNDFMDFKNKKRGKFVILIPIIGSAVIIGIIILFILLISNNKK